MKRYFIERNPTIKLYEESDIAMLPQSDQEQIKANAEAFTMDGKIVIMPGMIPSDRTIVHELVHVAWDEITRRKRASGAFLALRDGKKLIEFIRGIDVQSQMTETQNSALRACKHRIARFIFQTLSRGNPSLAEGMGYPGPFEYFSNHLKIPTYDNQYLSLCVMMAVKKELTGSPLPAPYDIEEPIAYRAAANFDYANSLFEGLVKNEMQKSLSVGSYSISWRALAAALLKAHNVSAEPRDADGRWTFGPGDIHPHGHKPNDTALIARAKDMGIAVPPRSWGLKINDDPNATLAVTWFDAKGKQQGAYSAIGAAKRDRNKLETLTNLHNKLPAIRTTIRKDLQRPDAEPQRVAAAVASIIDSTAMRVGSEIYAKENGTYGASSLRKDQVSVSGDKITFKFKGKHSKEHSIVMKNRLVANTIKHLMTLPGERLMQFHADSARQTVAPLTEDRVNGYLKPFHITAKSFRTYHASRMAMELLDAAGTPKDEKEAAKVITETVKKVADHLGNTPAVCRSSYINPYILADFASRVPSPR